MCSRFNAGINALFSGVFIRLSLSARAIALSLKCTDGMTGARIGRARESTLSRLKFKSLKNLFAVSHFLSPRFVTHVNLYLNPLLEVKETFAGQSAVVSFQEA